MKKSISEYEYQVSRLLSGNIKVNNIIITRRGDLGISNNKRIIVGCSKNGYAVGAFNVGNMEMVQVVIAAVEELRSSVIM